MRHILLMVCMAMLMTSVTTAVAAKIPTSLPELLEFYSAESNQPFDAERGKEFWLKKTPADDGKMRDCTVCHGEKLTDSGKHVKTGKVIDPMAPSVNKERYTDRKKVEKWFKRNCKWTIGRECTAQEKGDVLKYLSLH